MPSSLRHTHTFVTLFFATLLSMATAADVDAEAFLVHDYTKLMKNKKELVITRPALAYYWARHWLMPIGTDIGQETAVYSISMKSNPYKDKRPVSFTLYPQTYSVQLHHDAKGGLVIESIKYDKNTGKASLVGILASVGKNKEVITRNLYVKSLLTFPLHAKQWSNILLLEKALRLRIRLTLDIDYVNGNSRESNDYLDLEAKAISLSLMDLDKPILTLNKGLTHKAYTETATSLLMRKGVEVEKKGLDEASGLELDELISNESDESLIGRPKRNLRRLITAVELDHLPYAEGNQPFRRGWHRRDSFPGMKPDVLLFCEHHDLPKDVKIPLKKPLPPGMYKISLSSTYHRTRFFESRFKLKLGDGEVICREWRKDFTKKGGGKDDWFYAPAIKTSKPAKELILSAELLAHGGRGEAPPYPRRYIAIDRIFISNNMNDINGDTLDAP